jgi:hypothetical protein
MKRLTFVRFGLVLIGVVVAEGSALADTREECAASAEQAQALRDEGKYRRAREQMLVCARDICPGPIKSDCGRWLSELDSVAPTVVFGARVGEKDVADVRVTMDGVVVAEKLDGKPVLVDSGEHTFKFEHQGSIKEERVIIRAAEKARAIVVRFGEATTSPPPPPPPPGGDKRSVDEPSIVPPLIVGGIGVIALGSFAFFGIQGSNDVDELQKCKPKCQESAVDKARTKLIIADISLGIGVVAVAVSAYMILTRPKVDAKVQGASARKNVWLDLGPVAGGAAGAFGGTF